MSIRVGVNGFQHFHVYGYIKNLQAIEEVELVAIAEREDGLREEMGERYQVPAYADYRELLDQEQVDVMILRGINNERAKAICDCAEAGVHVLADKPIATTLEDLDRVEKAVKRHGVRLCMSAAGGYGALSQGLKGVIDSGELGELVSLISLSSHRWNMESRWGWKRPQWTYSREQSGGIIPDIGIHAINNFRWLTGKEVVAVTARTSNKRFPEHLEFEDNCIVLLEMEDDVTCFISSSWLTPDAEPSHGRGRTYINGTKGQIEIRSRDIAHGLEEPQEPEVILVTDEKPPHELPLPQGEMRTMERDFIASIVKGTEPLITSDFLIETMRVALLARDSADQHRTIKLQ